MLKVNLIYIFHSVERDNLTKMKHERDRLRVVNDKLKQQQGFVNNSLLVKDFEDRKVYIDDLNTKIQELQKQYKYLTQQGIS